MVALLRFLDAGKILVEHILAREAHGVKALEHFAVGVAAPVSARDVRDLDAVALDAAGGVLSESIFAIPLFGISPNLQFSASLNSVIPGTFKSGFCLNSFV